ncbi:MAG: antitoxin [Candidatus Altiarchaeota archaeon]|nr:antitoxin [Candidatus Altiarchaeota archaeon]
MTKIVSLSDTAYKRLSLLKGEKDSFSDVVIKLTEKEMKKSLIDFAGSWRGEKKETAGIFDEIKKERKSARMREVKL